MTAIPIVPSPLDNFQCDYYSIKNLKQEKKIEIIKSNEKFPPFVFMSLYMA